MKISQFEPQLNKIERILKKYELLKEREYHPRLPEHTASKFRSLGYREVWEKCYRERIFNFLLSDYSMLLFRIDNAPRFSLSYSYIDCPLNILSYEDFIHKSLELSLDEVGDMFMEEYEIELSSSKPRDSRVPLRYDYDEEAYRSGSHPVSHLHFGHESNLRLGTERILQPLSFVLMVLRQYYPHRWMEFVEDADAPILCRSVRESLKRVDPAYFQKLDNWELILK